MCSEDLFYLFKRQERYIGLAMSEEDPIRIPITDVFDLHSVPPRDARPVVEEYLEEAHNLGLKALRIIHGRGIGAQREMVRQVLSSKDYVMDFRDAPGEAGGWGATIVTLK
jgi:dsDNA-specific endonuclease/ATPase MutS2